MTEWQRQNATLRKIMTEWQRRNACLREARIIVQVERAILYQQESFILPTHLFRVSFSD